MELFPPKPNQKVFHEWLRLRSYQINHSPRYITLHRVGNTLIRRIVLRNGEMIETKIEEKENRG